MRTPNQSTRRQITIAATCLCLAVLSHPALAGGDSGRFTIQRDTELDGRVRIHQNLFLDLETAGRRVSGSYVETAGLLHHNSVFQGSRHEGRGQALLYLWQTNERGYNALHIGRQDGDRWVGTWIDNEGNQGDFQLLQGQTGEPVIELRP